MDTHENITYEEAFHEAKSIVDKIQNTEVSVDELSKLVDRASLLLNICKSKLKIKQAEIQEKIEKIQS